MSNTVVVVDYGGQYNQLIARRVRDAGVYAELVPWTMDADTISKKDPVGIILTGSPHSVNDADAPPLIAGILELGVPVLGICYGAQVIAKTLGGKVEGSSAREYGSTEVRFNTASPLFQNMRDRSIAWMSHSDHIARLPESFFATASTATVPVAAFENDKRTVYGVQFHPEVVHSAQGGKVLENFLYRICSASGGWNMRAFAENAVRAIRERVGDGRVLLALSGGVDSAVCAALLHRAIGDQLTCVFVNTGLMRKGEPEQVRRVFEDEFGMKLVSVNATERFLDMLQSVSDPERKRRLIGEEFIRIFEEEARRIGRTEFLAQGTIYPDVVESGAGSSALIKSHHNVGGLPEHMDFEAIIEPLRDLFKDEVRVLGEELGLPHDMVWRQPFPGPGLAIRIMGDVTEDKLVILREADAIFQDEIAKAGLAEKIWQYFAVLTDMRSVGVMGDERTYDYTVALRAVTSVDAMTADWARIPDDILASVSARIVNEVPHVNRVLYDITSKPPATIEFE